MDLKKFANLANKYYGGIHPNLLNSMYIHYTSDPKDFEERYFNVDEVHEKGFYFFDTKDGKFIVFGDKFISRAEDTIKIAGTIIAMTEDCKHELNTFSIFEEKSSKLLDTAQMLEMSEKHDLKFNEL